MNGSKMNYLAGPFNIVIVNGGLVSGRFNGVSRIIAEWKHGEWYVDKAKSSYREFKVQVQRHGQTEKEQGTI